MYHFGYLIGPRPGVPIPGLRRERELAALTQRQLADLAHVSRGTISRLEVGGDAFVSTVRRLADALQIEPRRLIQPDTKRP